MLFVARVCSFFYSVVLYYMVIQQLFIHSPVDGHLGYFKFLICVCVCICYKHLFTSFYMDIYFHFSLGNSISLSRITGLYGIFSTLRNCPTIFQSGSILDSH